MAIGPTIANPTTPIAVHEQGVPADARGGRCASTSDDAGEAREHDRARRLGDLEQQVPEVHADRVEPDLAGSRKYAHQVLVEAQVQRRGERLHVRLAAERQHAAQQLAVPREPGAAPRGARAPSARRHEDDDRGLHQHRADQALAQQDEADRTCPTRTAGSGRSGGRCTRGSAPAPARRRAGRTAGARTGSARASAAASSRGVSFRTFVSSQSRPNQQTIASSAAHDEREPQRVRRDRRRRRVLAAHEVDARLRDAELHEVRQHRRQQRQELEEPAIDAARASAR